MLITSVSMLLCKVHLLIESVKYCMVITSIKFCTVIVYQLPLSVTLIKFKNFETVLIFETVSDHNLYQALRTFHTRFSDLDPCHGHSRV